jgi:sialic acid synthase SpsE
MLRRLELGPDQHKELCGRCAKRGILFFSTPFDFASVDLLDSLGVPLFKLPSGEITNLPFLRYVAAKGRPVILSTGMSTLDEVSQAVTALREGGDLSLALLHCVSAYPAPPSEMNLRAMDTLRVAFNCPVGLSDHTLGTEVAVAAVARGARRGDHREALYAGYDPAGSGPSDFVGTDRIATARRFRSRGRVGPRRRGEAADGF